MAGALILMVEDSPVNRELAQDLLEINGYQVIAAENAEDGLTMARAHKPDLILMDISLPGMDGLEATRQLKADPATRAIPVVCLTAHAMSGDMDKALDAGASGYISKPIDTRQFASQIAGHLQD